MMLSWALVSCQATELTERRRPPDFPTDPDGVCPPEFSLSAVGVSHQYTWLTGSDDYRSAPPRSFEAYLGRGTLDDLETWEVRRGDSATELYAWDEYVCDGGNAWLAALELVQDPADLDCEHRDYAFEGNIYDPPRLEWWGDGVADGLSWTSRFSVTLAYSYVVGCELTVATEDIGPAHWTQLTPLGSATVETPAGDFHASGIEWEASWNVDPITIWYSADVGGAVVHEAPEAADPFDVRLADYTMGD